MRKCNNSIYSLYIQFRQKEYSKSNPLRVWAGTWNANGKLVEEDVKTWIKNDGLRLYDMYVLGLEEMVPLTVSSVLFNYNVSTKKNKWVDCILEVLKSIHGIVLL